MNKMIIQIFDSENSVYLADLSEAAPVDGEIKPHQLGELVIAVAQHVGEVVGPVQVGVDGSDAAAFTVQVAVDLGSDAGQFGNQVHRVLVDKLEDKRKRTQTGDKTSSLSQEASSWRRKPTSQYLVL